MPNAAENPAKKPIICYVTDGKSLGGGSRAPNVLAKMRAAVAAGVNWVQIREKDLLVRELLELVQEAVRVTAETRSGEGRVIVNDRLDVALAAGAAGVHLGGDSLPAGDVVRWCRSGNALAEFLIGASCHAVEEVRDAEASGASYVFFGPVFDTPSKESFGPPQGLAKLAQVCSTVQIPVIAIGGVNENNAEECLAAGAAGVAAIRWFQEARDATELRNAIQRLRDARRSGPRH